MALKLDVNPTKPAPKVAPVEPTPAAPVDPKVAQAMEALFGPKPPDRAKMSWSDAAIASDAKKERIATAVTALMDLVGEDIEMFVEVVDNLDIPDFGSFGDLQEEKEEAEAQLDRLSFVQDLIPQDISVIEQIRIEQFFQELRP